MLEDNSREDSLTKIKTSPHWRHYCVTALQQITKQNFLSEMRYVYLAKAPLPSTAPLPPLPLIKGLLPV